MRKAFFLYSLLLTAILFTAYSLGAQDPITFPPIDQLTPANLFDLTVEPLYGTLVFLFGYISTFIPVVNRWKPFLRVVSFGLIVGLGWFLFGGASIWKIAITYFLTSGLYAAFFKNIFPSPKAKTSA